MNLIDVDELKKKLEAEHCDCEIMAMIDNMPTIDAETVKHGRWIIHRGEIFEPNRSECYINRPLPTECSVCGFAEMRASRFAFCPSCGARMDGDNND
jgi:rubrerythrin